MSNTRSSERKTNNQVDYVYTANKIIIQVAQICRKIPNKYAQDSVCLRQKAEELQRTVSRINSIILFNNIAKSADLKVHEVELVELYITALSSVEMIYNDVSRLYRIKDKIKNGKNNNRLVGYGIFREVNQAIYSERSLLTRNLIALKKRL